MELKKSHVLITGANRGIGRAVAEICAESGSHLLLAQRKPDSELAELLLRKGAASVKNLVLDMSTPENIDDFLQKIKDETVEILFNNAGQLEGGLLEQQDIKAVYKMMQVNLNGLIHLTHGILPRMLKQKRGKIINNSSVSAVMQFPTASTYAASKAGVMAFTNSLRSELKGTGVSTLLLITPGVETRMYAEIPGKHGDHLNVKNLSSISAEEYAKRIQEAILEDMPVLKPLGLAGAALWAAQHTRSIFDRAVQSGFKR